jgi:nucleoside-diphosphate-sugar epimerase
MTNYAITGHRGIIGEFLKKALDTKGAKCVLHIDQKEGFNVVDLMFEETSLKDTDKIDTFFHLAAQCKINESIARPILPHRNNVDGIFSVLEFCRKHNVKKVVVTSTSRVLSKERNPYVASKIYVEELVKAYHDCYGIDYIIIRPSTVYGPTFDSTSRLISNFITSALKGEDLKIYGDENKTLDFTYVDDFVDGVMLAIEGPWNKEYNISGENEVKLFDLAKEVIQQTGSKSKIIFTAQEKAQPQQVKIDTSEIKKLGYKPKISMEKGVEKMIKWYKKNPWALEEYEDKGLQYYDENKI